MADDAGKRLADAQFKKAQRDADGKKAMVEYEAQAAAMRAKTARLRELRLARDAAMPPAAPAKKKSAKAAKAAAGTLSDWLQDRRDSGHNH